MYAPLALASTTSEKKSDPLAAIQSGPSSDTKGTSLGMAVGTPTPGNRLGEAPPVDGGMVANPPATQARAGQTDRNHLDQRSWRGRMRRHEITDRLAAPYRGGDCQLRCRAAAAMRGTARLGPGRPLAH